MPVHHRLLTCSAATRLLPASGLGTDGPKGYRRSCRLAASTDAGPSVHGLRFSARYLVRPCCWVQPPVHRRMPERPSGRRPYERATLHCPSRLLSPFRHKQLSRAARIPVGTFHSPCRPCTTSASRTVGTPTPHQPRRALDHRWAQPSWRRDSRPCQQRGAICAPSGAGSPRQHHHRVHAIHTPVLPKLRRHSRGL